MENKVQYIHYRTPVVALFILEEYHGTGYFCSRTSKSYCIGTSSCVMRVLVPIMILNYFRLFTSNQHNNNIMIPSFIFETD
jgi:hypothetical protein